MDMKTLTALFLIIIFNSRNVASFPIFEVVGVKLKNFADSFMITMKTFKTTVNNLLTNHFNNINQPQHTIEENERRAFSNIIEDISEDNETDTPELINLQSEPTARMSTPQLAKYHGKSIETHVVITDDGYLLTIHRLMKPLDPPFSDKLNQRTVLLHHGLLGSSADWILLGPQKSLPYILDNLGFDVWMTNARGNYYSRGHVNKNVKSLEYWQFSWQEMGKYDLPAVIDYIRIFKKSNDTMDFIGHSMGATALLVLLSTTPSYNNYFRVGILLAPLAYMSNIEGPLRTLGRMAKNLSEKLLKLLGEGEFLSSRKIPLWVVKKYCTGNVLYCSNPLLFLSGNIPEIESWNSSLVANVMYHVPAGGSTNTILHYAHLAETGKFQNFRENTEFPLKKVNLSIALFSSSDDCIATVPDVFNLYFSISNPLEHYIIRGKNLTHTEFVFGPEVDVLVFNRVISLLEHGSSNTSAKRKKLKNN